MCVVYNVLCLLSCSVRFYHTYLLGLRRRRIVNRLLCPILRVGEVLPRRWVAQRTRYHGRIQARVRRLWLRAMGVDGFDGESVPLLLTSVRLRCELDDCVQGDLDIRQVLLRQVVVVSVSAIAISQRGRKPSECTYKHRRIAW